MLTLKQLQAHAKAKGVSVRYSSEWGEYRVTWPQERYTSKGMTVAQAREAMERQAYYTSDRQEAWDMVEVFASNEPSDCLG